MAQTLERRLLVVPKPASLRILGKQHLPYLCDIAVLLKVTMETVPMVGADADADANVGVSAVTATLASEYNILAIVCNQYSGQ